MTIFRTFMSVVIGLGFTLATLSADENGVAQQNLNGGYYLLHKLYENESQLPLLLDLKTAPPAIKTFADQVSRAAKEGLATLDRLRASDPHMNWDHDPLPKIEQDVREAIKGEKQHQLLFGTNGPDFVRALLISQAEATKYAANLDKVLAEQDENPDHQRDLQRMAAQWHQLDEEVFRLLARP
jgi:hypothetical protein